MKTVWKALFQTFGKVGTMIVLLFILELIGTMIYGVVISFPDWKTIAATFVFSGVVFFLIWDIIRNAQKNKEKSAK